MKKILYLLIIIGIVIAVVFLTQSNTNQTNVLEVSDGWIGDCTLSGKEANDSGFVYEKDNTQRRIYTAFAYGLEIRLRDGHFSSKCGADLSVLNHYIDTYDLTPISNGSNISHLPEEKLLERLAFQEKSWEEARARGKTPNEWDLTAHHAFDVPESENIKEVWESLASLPYLQTVIHRKYVEPDAFIGLPSL